MRIKKGSISHRPERKTSPWRWRYANKDRYFSSEKAAKEAQAEFLKTRSVVGSSVADAFRGSLERYAVEAFSILKEAGLDDPKFLVEAAKIRATRGTCSLSLSEAMEKMQESLEFISRAKDTTRMHLGRWRRFIDDVDDLQLVAVETSHIREHLNKVAEDISLTEASNTYTALSAYFRKYMLEIGVEIPDLMKSIKRPPSGEVDSKIPYYVQEMAAIEAAMFEANAPKDDQLMYQIQKLAGYRGSEVVRLMFRDIGMKRVPLSLKEEVTIHFTAGNTKERKQRTRGTCKKLHLEFLLNDWFTSHYERKGMELVLKPEFEGKPLYTHVPATFTNKLHKWVEAAGVEWKTNSLRHSYISAAIKGRFGGQIEPVKDSVGHVGDSNVIRNNYMHYYTKSSNAHSSAPCRRGDP
jgi:integrase